jgi:hypothetical protein
VKSELERFHCIHKDILHLRWELTVLDRSNIGFVGLNPARHNASRWFLSWIYSAVEAEAL